MNDSTLRSAPPALEGMGARLVLIAGVLLLTEVTWTDVPEEPKHQAGSPAGSFDE